MADITQLKVDLLQSAKHGISSRALVLRLKEQGYEKRDIQRALQSCLERGQLGLGSEMQLETRNKHASS